MALEPGEEAPEWHPVLARRLASDVSCGFEGTPLEEALDYLQSVSKFNVVIDPDLAKVPAVPRTVSADLQCVELRRALAWVLDEAGLECCALDGALYVSTREGVQKMLKRE